MTRSTTSATSGAQAAANAELAASTGKPLKSAVLGPAWKEITFTADPDAASLSADAQQAEPSGCSAVNLSGIFDLTPLNNLLSAVGQSSVSGSP